MERCYLVIEVVKENASKRCIAIVPDPLVLNCLPHGKR